MTFNIYSDGPPLSSTPARDAEWHAKQSERRYAALQRKDEARPMPFGSATAGVMGGFGGTIAQQDMRRIEEYQRQVIQAQALQQFIRSNPGLMGNLGSVMQPQVSEVYTPVTATASPAVEELEQLRVRELDLDPVADVAEPTIKAREIEL